jgi:hypothetical protein
MENSNIKKTFDDMLEQKDKEFYFFKKVSLVDKYNFYEYLSVMLD